MKLRLLLLPVLFAAGCAPAAAPAATGPSVTFGSKKFTESVILGEVLKHLARNAGAAGVHRRELGGTRIVWNALLAGAIDAYVDYTGTLSKEIFAERGLGDDEEAIRKALDAQGIRMSRSLGFANNYEIAMKEDVAERLGIRTISDLREHPDLKFGFGNEFMDRADGWPALRDRYRLPQRDVHGLDHDLAYRGIDSGAIDVMDTYSTDADQRYYSLRVLGDDLGHFPEYDAVLVYRAGLRERAPRVVKALLQLEGRISESTMKKMNARVKLDGESESRVAADFLDRTFGVRVAVTEAGFGERLVRTTGEHLVLVGISLMGAICVSVPLGIMAARRWGSGHAVLATVGILQTIPSFALLALMVPLVGIGAKPIIVALFLYSLLPIVRNTYTGLHDIPLDIRDSAAALGLPRRARLWLVELPMASRTILAGIKTSAVINVGTATLGAIVGAGGYGGPIVTGIRLDNTALILEGAVPAAALALIVQQLFELADRVVVPKGLRLERHT